MVKFKYSNLNALQNNYFINRSDEKIIEVLFIGRNIPRKGIKKFIKIAKIIRNVSKKNINFTLAYSGSNLKLKNSFIKVIKIDSINDNRELYKNADILYCPFKNEALGLVPIEGIGCHVFFDKTIPSINDFKKYGTEIPNSIKDEIKIWLSILNKIKKLRSLRSININSVFNELNQMIL